MSTSAQYYRILYEPVTRDGFELVDADGGRLATLNLRWDCTASAGHRSGARDGSSTKASQ